MSIASKTVLVATAGPGILRSNDDGKSWKRLPLGLGIEFDANVRCLLPDPLDPAAIFAGAEHGLHRSEDCGASWQRVSCVLDYYTPWSLAVCPHNKELMFAGTGSPSRAALFRSEDGGQQWRKLELEMPERCAGVSRPRMLALAVDPVSSGSLWIGVEEGGLFRSDDGGERFTRVDTPEAGVRNSDIHSIVILPGPPKTIIVMVVNAIYVSTDDGATWAETDSRERFGYYYSRVLARKPASNDVFIGLSDGTPGTTSLFFKSEDCGGSWRQSEFPVTPNSCLWALGLNEADPELCFAGTKYGDLFRSVDGGATWSKEWRAFSEIADVAWIPAS
jgi:photosystem II stability/assembly factor-like uncharacterized protein